MKGKTLSFSVAIVLSLLVSQVIFAAENIAEIGNKISVDVGKRGAIFTGSIPYQFVIFEENHKSRAGQLEIAIMLNRLYQQYGVRHFALEGAVKGKDILDASFFHKLPDEEIKVDIALQQLKDGEISAAEFTTMLYKDFILHPVEDEKEYAVELTQEAQIAPIMYLYKIASKSLTPEQRGQANSLIQQDKQMEAIEFIINSNLWTNERYKIINSSDIRSVSLEDMVKVSDELVVKANEVKADVSQAEGSLQQFKKFFSTAIKRSETIVNNAFSIAKSFPQAPVVINVGALHTADIANFLKDKTASFVVVTPRSLLNGNKRGDLPSEAYKRKLNNQSVGPAGTLGALLDGRRKPPPSLTQPWHKTISAIMVAGTTIARAIASGGGMIPPNKPPFNERDLGLSAKGCPIRINLMELITVKDKNERISTVFPVKILAENKTIWMAVQTIPIKNTEAVLDLEATLKQILKEINESRSEKGLIAMNVKAVVSSSKEGAISTVQGGS
ncbi:MAG: hypothetical protein D3918_13300 [Candidatus Electrothrix sp. AX2]|nr:hypothetical protein [Candidatus Electrothrix gigas]